MNTQRKEQIKNTKILQQSQVSCTHVQHFECSAFFLREPMKCDPGQFKPTILFQQSKHLQTEHPHLFNLPTKPQENLGSLSIEEKLKVGMNSFFSCIHSSSNWECSNVLLLFLPWEQCLSTTQQQYKESNCKDFTLSPYTFQSLRIGGGQNNF